MTMDSLIPTQIILHQKSKTLEVEFNSGERFVFSCEYLRVFSPSAEVRGHGVGNQKWITGKADINIVSIEPVGSYGIKPIFDDGHASGIYSWNTLHELGVHQEKNWQLYQEKVKWTKNS